MTTMRRNRAACWTVLLLWLGAVGVVAAQDEPRAADDLGLSGAVRPEADLLFGGQPTAEQLAAAEAAGYRTIVDLRTESEDRGFDEVAEAARLGLEYRSIPVDAEALQRDETYEAFFAALEGPRPLVAHCASGNRVGGLYYAFLVAKKGLSREAALERARASGLRSDALARTVDQWLDRRAKP
jgi:uncharacterized protein (TIGR01244 family)